MYIDKPKDFEPFGVNINSLVNHTYDEKCNIVFPCMPYVNLYSNSALKKVFSEACKVFAEENSKALGFCLYRYAVDIDVIMQMIAGITNYTDKEVSEFWHDAKNNIRRTRGRIPPEEIAKGYYINFKSGKNYFDNPPTDDLL